MDLKPEQRRHDCPLFPDELQNGENEFGAVLQLRLPLEDGKREFLDLVTAGDLVIGVNRVFIGAVGHGIFGGYAIASQVIGL